MTTLDLPARKTARASRAKAPAADSAAAPDALTAGAPLYRRLERRQPQSQRLMRILFVLIAAAVTAGVLAVERTTKPAATAEAAANDQR